MIERRKIAKKGHIRWRKKKKGKTAIHEKVYTNKKNGEQEADKS